MNEPLPPVIHADEAITIPLAYFKEIVLGIREKSVLRQEVVDIIKSTPCYEDFFYIQETSAKSLPFVWCALQWKTIGFHQEVLRESLKKDRDAADRLCDILRTKIPAGIDGNALKALALTYIHNKTDLSGFGINIEDYYK